MSDTVIMVAAANQGKDMGMGVEFASGAIIPGAE
jgi:hypothetical protein